MLYILYNFKKLLNFKNENKRSYSVFLNLFFKKKKKGISFTNYQVDEKDPRVRYKSNHELLSVVSQSKKHKKKISFKFKNKNIVLKRKMIYNSGSLLRYNFCSENFTNVIGDYSFNPILGGLGKGFPSISKNFDIVQKFMYKRYLRPRWFRLNKFINFKKFINKLYINFNFIKGYRNTLVFMKNFKKKKNMTYIFQFYIRKRWFLAKILKK